MSKFVKFPSIDQFRNVCKHVIGNCEYHNEDKPVIHFQGTVKIHGTNAGVGYDYDTGELWVQSRNRVISVGNDNAGFALFVEKYKEEFIKIFDECFSSVDKNGRNIIFGEWYGNGVQKGVAVSELDKRFTIFEHGSVEDDGVNWFIDFHPEAHHELVNKEFPVDHISHYQTFSEYVDFTLPEKSIEKFQALTEQVEKECPVGKAHGVSGVGEGVVWYGVYKEQILRFKVKGEKHSVSKVKKLVSVDIEKLESIQKFVNYAVTENRLEQGIQEVFNENDLEPDIKKLGELIRWVHNDVLKEEIDTLKGNGLEQKDYGKELANRTREWFMKNYV